MDREETDADSIGIAAVDVTDSFWSPRIRTNREITIGHQYEQLEGSGTLENFRRVAEGETGGFRGMWFQDSDAYKWLEAASYVLAADDDPELESRVDDVVESVAAAQEDDGYLNTYFALEEPDKRWTNLHMMHELYCGGHLIEAAVAHYRVTGDRTLLDVGIDFADHVIDVFDDFDGVPGHEGIELALVKLYRVTGRERYLDLAEYFVDRRGRTDRLAREFDRYDEIGGSAYDGDWEGTIEDGARSVFVDEGRYDGSYAQDHAPVVDQGTVEGHSVRAMYLYAGTADLARERRLPEFVDALEDLWENMTQKRTYITGGVGSEPAHEGFTEDYELRNEGAYAETCAAVGSVFWNQRMFELTGEAKYVDLIERTLYNGFLAGVSLDGTEFFYENPLASDGDHHRKGWFTCACCPPNVARLFASLGRYIYARRDSGVTVNQYIGSTARTSISGETVSLSQESALPWSGEVTIDVDATGVSFPIRLRIPRWAESTTVTVNGERVDVPSSGYLEVKREWTDDRIELTFEQTVTRMAAHPAVEADAGRIALERGPLVYCLEDVDHDRPLHQYEISTATFSTEHRPELLDGVTVIEGEASVPKLDGWDTELYRPASETDRGSADFTAVPYFAWDNRDPGPMRVWIRSGS